MSRGGQVSGLVSLAVVFIALCLCMFAVLALSTADRERTLSERTAAQAEEYDAADRAAVAWFAERRAALAGEALPEGYEEARSFPVGRTRTLEAAIRQEEGALRVVLWRTVYTGTWETDDRIEVWSGN